MEGGRRRKISGEKEKLWREGSLEKIIESDRVLILLQVYAHVNTCIFACTCSHSVFGHVHVIAHMYID